MIHLALAQIAPTLGDMRANLELHRKTALAARRAGADLVVFPELSLTGYLLHDLVEDIAIPKEGSPELEGLLSLSRRIPLVVGLVERGTDQICYNSALFLAAGKVIHRHRKAYLPTYGMFDEGRTFGQGDRFQAFSTPLGRFGMLICEDAWHLSSSYLLALDGADCLLILSSGPLHPREAEDGIGACGAWPDLCRGIARFLTVHVVYVNRVGVEDGIPFAGGSCAVDPLGKTLALSGSVQEDLLQVRLSSAALRRARIRTPLLRDERTDLVRRHLEQMARHPWEPGGHSMGHTPSRKEPARGRLG